MEPCTSLPVPTPPGISQAKTYTGVWATSSEDNVVRLLYIALVKALQKAL